MTVTLQQIAQERPYPEYQQWWPMGQSFLNTMGAAILQSWQETASDPNDHSLPDRYLAQYIETVYRRQPRVELGPHFRERRFSTGFFSGEFDAVSYAYFRGAFENIRQNTPGKALRSFTQTVGRRFFSKLADTLQLDIPTDLSTPEAFNKIQTSISRIGDFLVQEGYLRDSFAFTFDCDLAYQNNLIRQSTADFLDRLTGNRIGYALYRMGYPVILPSAVYLFHTLGEAQHHSSRTMEELFARAGCQARETDDFDPTGFPADEVVELWEIRPLD